MIRGFRKNMGLLTEVGEHHGSIQQEFIDTGQWV
jgi:hypothetical protein